MLSEESKKKKGKLRRETNKMANKMSREQLKEMERKKTIIIHVCIDNILCMCFRGDYKNVGEYAPRY